MVKRREALEQLETSVFNVTGPIDGINGIEFGDLALISIRRI